MSRNVIYADFAINKEVRDLLRNLASDIPKATYLSLFIYSQKDKKQYHMLDYRSETCELFQTAMLLFLNGHRDGYLLITHRYHPESEELNKTGSGKLDGEKYIIRFESGAFGYLAKEDCSYFHNDIYTGNYIFQDWPIKSPKTPPFESAFRIHLKVFEAIGAIRSWHYRSLLDSGSLISSYAILFKALEPLSVVEIDHIHKLIVIENPIRTCNLFHSNKLLVSPDNLYREILENDIYRLDVYLDRNSHLSKRQRMEPASSSEDIHFVILTDDDQKTVRFRKDHVKAHVISVEDLIHIYDCLVTR